MTRENITLAVLALLDSAIVVLVISLLYHIVFISH
jgi:hypothetical protein